MRRWLALSIVVFLATLGRLARELRAGRARLTFHIWPGGHESRYWHRHIARYLKFHADACR